MGHLPLLLALCGCPPVTAEDCCPSLVAMAGAHCPLRAGERNHVVLGVEGASAKGLLLSHSSLSLLSACTFCPHHRPHTHLRKRMFSSKEVSGRTETQWRSGRPADDRSRLLPREPTAELAQTLLSIKVSRVQGPTKERAAEGVWVPVLLQILNKVKQQVLDGPQQGLSEGQSCHYHVLFLRQILHSPASLGLESVSKTWGKRRGVCWEVYLKIQVPLLPSTYHLHTSLVLHFMSKNFHDSIVCTT